MAQSRLSKSKPIQKKQQKKQQVQKAMPKCQRQRQKTAQDQLVMREQKKLSKSIGQNAEDIIIQRANLTSARLNIVCDSETTKQKLKDLNRNK